MPTTTPAAPAATRKQAALVETTLELEDRLAALVSELEIVRGKLVDSIGFGNSIEVADVARVTVTRNTSVTVDFETLVKAKPGWARRVTKKVLDQAKLTHLVKADAIPEDVKPLLVLREGPLFARITRR